MMTYSYEILPLHCIIAQDGLTNVVESVPWRYTGTDEDGSSFTLVGVTKVPSPNPETFTPFASLTREIITEWLNTLQDQTTTQQIIVDQIYKAKNPTTVVLTLP